jgi:hypothetical protein
MVRTANVEGPRLNQPQPGFGVDWGSKEIPRDGGDINMPKIKELWVSNIRYRQRLKELNINLFDKYQPIIPTLVLIPALPMLKTSSSRLLS